MTSQNNDAIIALVAAIFGGAGLRVIDFMLGRSANRSSEAKQIRDELRQEILSLRSELGEVRDDLNEKDRALDEWKEKYFNLLGGESAAMKSVLNALKDIQKTIEKDQE